MGHTSNKLRVNLKLITKLVKSLAKDKNLCKRTDFSELIAAMEATGILIDVEEYSLAMSTNDGIELVDIYCEGASEIIEDALCDLEDAWDALSSKLTASQMQSLKPLFCVVDGDEDKDEEDDDYEDEKGVLVTDLFPYPLMIDSAGVLKKFAEDNAGFAVFDNTTKALSFQFECRFDDGHPATVHLVEITYDSAAKHFAAVVSVPGDVGILSDLTVGSEVPVKHLTFTHSNLLKLVTHISNVIIQD